ncbi:hypothetical protein [Maritimibacter sp. UBA3975]|uniref:hypothetical protein n=1 Tax=Maritimibacter sp. UBA3975 TaxID=1946833 RepID=UPI000C0B3EE8|nr:hypothetical protein [Maritimibacter sp. UBA3975]MAM63867.1 hypothetical protein [Maritimibacter sp.]
MKTTEQRHEETRERLAQFEEMTQTKAPDTIWDEDGAPTDEILIYAKSNGLSLDWLFLGDPLPSILYLHDMTIKKEVA